MEAVSFRFGTVEDAEAIARHRCEMFKEMGTLSEAGSELLYPASVHHFRREMADGRYVAWLACDKNAIVGGGGMQLQTIPPRPGPDRGMLREGPQGFIVNVFVERDWRRRGIAKELICRMISFAKNSGMPVLGLHASDAGRSLYEYLGFSQTSEMRLFI